MTAVYIPLSLLEVDSDEIYRNMGMDFTAADKEITALVSESMKELLPFCHPRYGYTIYPITDRDTSGITISGKRFNMGKIITRFFAQAEYCAVFVATAGNKFTSWYHSENVSGDIVKALIGDCIGSEIAEAAARRLAQDITVKYEAKGLKTGNSYSPGYCGWDISEQHKLFSLFPNDPCGIILNESGLMNPVKSVSGFIPIGRDVKKMPYGCAICKRSDCYKNKHNQKSN
ncbi:vitamin B12 dependent-methionine synthase activation domain-containing protein [Prevotella sp. 10(H)]|uniref:vitamin B12 dependent-methionine synthase activation domain-containing protein n=1 Tax=Prevotella sp. 10(H) TaxID=1158294 RepID=UPI0004A72EA1|nr:vitamin B12 dependent-methionine synthase activation domain-containing protein [Prevotella sp. 10(H)]